MGTSPETTTRATGNEEAEHTNLDKQAQESAGEL